MPRIVITVPDQPPRRYRFELDSGSVSFGRGVGNDVTIESGSVSASHAIMERVPGGYQLRDLGSTNGITLDDSRRETIALCDGLDVRLGEVALAFSLAPEEQAILAAATPAATPPRPLPSAANWKGAARRLERGAERRSLRRLAWGCGIGLLAIFGGLELLSMLPKISAPAETAVVAVPLAAPVAAPQIGQAPAAAKPALVPPPAVTPDAPPAVEPEPPEIADAPPTEADRLAAEPALLLTGMDATRDAAVARDTALLLRAVDGKAWDAYRALLGRSLKAALAKQGQRKGVNGYDSVWGEPALYQALLRWKILGCFSEPEITALVTDSYTAGMLKWLLHENKQMEELLLTIKVNDDGGKVLKFLMEAWSSDEKLFKKYFPLALACAVVFDRPMSIPNVVGDPKLGVETAVEPLQRFKWFVAKNEAGKLIAPVHHSSARDLVWVVCAPVTTSELEWAIAKISRYRKNWGDTYGMIEYLMERAVEGLNPYKEYSFAEILKEGGICGDQAYFCVNTARAQGIPAMIIAGETDSGGHAWAGAKIRDDEWTTGIGRIGGASKGEADNPQTGAAISEQEIQLWGDRAHQSELLTRTTFRFLWLADYCASAGDTTAQAATVRIANRLGHSFTETWKALFGVLERETQLTGEPPKPDNLDEWKKFAAAVRLEFKENPRMGEIAATAEDQYIFPYGEDNAARSALRLQRRKIERNAGEQKDIIATSLKREADLIFKAGGPDATRNICNLYDRALRDFGGSITAFKMMAEDYFAFCKDDKELARKAARDVELAFKRVVETGTKDFFRATTEASICQMICSYYRAAGDTARADQLQRRYEILLRRSKRSAV
ncbi:MAG: hypothetical protein RLZZ522_1146 [Verrucomicrobiota bacterium]